MVNTVDRNTTLCISLAARPSNHGVRFHNWLYEQLGLNFLYKAVAPTDITAAVAGIRGLDIRGAGVSMPYKQDVIALIDALDPSAERLSAVNTIVHEDGVLTGYNTDYTAVRQLLRTAEVDPDLPVAVRGSGGMANAVVAALADHGLSGVVVARNHLTGAALASRYEWDYSAQVPQEAQFLVNVTPIGMHGPDPEVSQAQAFSDDELSRARIVLDAVAFPTNTPLVRAARSRDIPVITGAQIAALQAAEQFALYTGVRPSPEQVAAAEEYASAPEAQSAQ
ncbi:shikimate 5-dehydrogenase [Corynebacterium uberis]|uniref:shikimate 5-dehydrogenase n=1 Tax=Corynebacterium TaxID=1716 RepID=UPI001D0B2174|nr:MULTISPECIES: shikimate 5-dehydrogenase [Corynebacterium]MCZ9308981.1 shikimate 5-dehydrogenase [Corynebacterium sp. c6VSa_13]UDL74549.1 shikimate 5-dehydrogenase [Corynebacterium uberis]UDL76617.1 shikimate 5-dehydrogenase [Corynebacterium uberis]UDL78830.1 shikimate 5-dehydrogenase [Corynebacterium uberis]UDL81108.1 shikimate 5-dehydrogenase [Corynebacterium uberis]